MSEIKLGTKIMKQFTVPIVYTTTGWVYVLAEDMDSAKKKVEEMNENGVEYFDIQDPECHSECMVDEILFESDLNDSETVRHYPKKL